MQALDDYLNDLRSQERDLLLRLTAVRASIDTIVKGQLNPELPITPMQAQGPQCPSLDNMRIRHAINMYLGFRRANGMPPATVGELEKELAKHRVVSFRNQPMSEMRYAFKTLCITLGSPENKALWRVERRDPDGHFTRADTIELRPSESNENNEVSVGESARARSWDAQSSSDGNL